MLLTFLLWAWAAIVPSGCRLIQATADLPGSAVRVVSGGGNTEKPPDPVVLQQDLFRFADEVSVGLNREIVKAIEEGTVDLSPTQAIEFRLAVRNRLIEIVTGPNAFVSLVDLVFVVAMLDHAMENYFASEVFMDQAHAMVVMLHEAREQVVELAASYLGTEQKERLEAIIQKWLERNFKPSEALYSRYRGLSEDLLATQKKESNQPTSLFGALMLDPLAGLDPTIRELAQARLLAERAMFVAQRTPPLLRLQMELFSLRMLERPETQQMLEQTGMATEALERVSKVVAELPDQISAEREAILQALSEQSETLTGLMRETNATLSTGTEAITQTNTLVASVDTLLDHLGVYDPPDPNAPPEEPGEPFRIQDYIDALRELQQTADRLNIVVVTLDQTLATATSDEVVAKLESASGAAVAQGQGLVDYAFMRALLLFALCAVITGGVVVAVRLIPGRRKRGGG